MLCLQVIQACWFEHIPAKSPYLRDQSPPAEGMTCCMWCSNCASWAHGIDQRFIGGCPSLLDDDDRTDDSTDGRGDGASDGDSDDDDSPTVTVTKMATVTMMTVTTATVTKMATVTMIQH